MKSMILRSAMIVVASVVTFHIAGCNTMKGVGKDTEAVGEKVQDVADDAKN